MTEFWKESIRVLGVLALTGSALSASPPPPAPPTNIAGVPSGFAAEKGCGIFFNGNALYLKAEQAGTEYATPSNAAGTVPNGPDATPNFTYKWGFRVGLGWDTSYDGWDLYADWTRFHNSYSDSLHASSGNAILNNSSINTAVAVNVASAAFRLALDLIDFELGRDFSVSKSLALRPFIGLRNGWVKEKQLVQYTGGALGLNSPDIISFVNNFWGIGLRGGMNTRWIFATDWSLFGNMAFALLAGKYTDLSVVETSGANATLVTSVTDNYDVNKAVVDFQAGLAWNHIFDDRFHLGVQVGWEQHFFSNMWQWQDAAFSPTPNGDLSLSGWFGSVRFDF